MESVGSQFSRANSLTTLSVKNMYYVSYLYIRSIVCCHYVRQRRPTLDHVSVYQIQYGASLLLGVSFELATINMRHDTATVN
jgi:hypothetical protein